MSKIRYFILPIIVSALLTGCAADAVKENVSAVPSETKSTTNVAETTPVADGMDYRQYSSDKVVWGPGRADGHQRPRDPVLLQEQYGALGAEFIGGDKKEIYLTFDEGYENGYTPAILDTLKEKGVKAAFFVTYDFAQSNPGLVRRMLDEGHAVGNHTYRHLTMDEIGIDRATEEIVFLDSFISQNFDYKMTLFRFPKGEFSERTLALAKELGYTSVFWSFAYSDWDTENPPDKAQALDLITKHTHNGEIMLLHAVSETNAAILGDVIDAAREQGYEFAKLPQA
jgi:peptidoglycan-N-acetylmuramic acid deacetylase